MIMNRQENVPVNHVYATSLPRRNNTSDARGRSSNSTPGRSREESVGSYQRMTGKNTRGQSSRPIKIHDKTEAKRVSKIVQLKLEDYMNFKKREELFNVFGALKTTNRMESFDTAYYLLENLSLEKSSMKSPRNNKSRPQTSQPISARVLNNSRRVIKYSEAERLENNVNRVYESVPIPTLVALNFRSVGVQPPGGHHQGFTTHIGAALRQHKFKEFYEQCKRPKGKSKSTSTSKASSAKYDSDTFESSSDEDERNNNK